MHFIQKAPEGFRQRRNLVKLANCSGDSLLSRPGFAFLVYIPLALLKSPLEMLFFFREGKSKDG